MTQETKLPPFAAQPSVATTWTITYPQVKALAAELLKAAESMGSEAHDSEYEGEELVLQVRQPGTISNDDGSLNERPLLAISLFDYPEEGVYPIDPTECPTPPADRQAMQNQHAHDIPAGSGDPVWQTAMAHRLLTQAGAPTSDSECFLSVWGRLVELLRMNGLRLEGGLGEPLRFVADRQPNENLPIEDYEEVLADHRRLVRELDVLLNGEEGAAKQASLCDIVAQVRRDRQKLENAMVDIVPPATQRERWMYQQGRLAERDPRTPGSLAHETQQCGEPIDGYTLAMKVREDLDRQACPDFYMTTAVESIVRHLESPPPKQQATEPAGTVYWRNANPTVEWVGRPPDDGEHVYTKPQPQQQAVGPVTPGMEDLIERLLDAQQDINLAANQHMSQSLCDASAIIDEVEQVLRRLSPQPQQIPEGYKLVPIEPTEEMVVEGFESAPDEHFTPKDEWERFQAMSGCQQAAHKARLCWEAMIKAAPKP